MKVVRAAFIAVIVLDLALLAVAHPQRAVSLRYALAARQKALRALEGENRALTLAVAEARRPDRVAARAAAFGLKLQTVEHELIDRSVVGGRSVVHAPRR